MEVNGIQFVLLTAEKGHCSMDYYFFDEPLSNVNDSLDPNPSSDSAGLLLVSNT